MRKAFVFDLDETLINSFPRQYAVVKDFIQQYNPAKKVYGYEDYLQIRRSNKLTNTDFYSMHHLPEDSMKHFRTFFLDNIELPKYLTFDERMVDLNLFREFSQRYSLHLVSLRKNELLAKEELKRFQLDTLFESIHFLKHDHESNVKIPILQQLSTTYEVIAFLGDSRKDEEAAQHTGIPFIQIGTGIEEPFCKNYFPHINSFLSRTHTHANV